MIIKTQTQFGFLNQYQFHLQDTFQTKTKTQMLVNWSHYLYLLSLIFI